VKSLSPVAELNDTLSEVGLNLTLDEVAQRLNLSVEAAHALVVAGLKGLSETTPQTQEDSGHFSLS
jgi:hypothetical protein